MDYLEQTLPTVAENLALDEALLLQAEAGQGGEVLRLWEWPHPVVILGSACRLADEVKENACRHDGVPILRRASGGGTVLLGRGCLLYSLILDYDRSAVLRSIPASYEFILATIRRGLLDLVPGIERAGTSDLVVAGRKFSGNSQQRKRRFLLHHGTLLYDFDLASIERYLHVPARQPGYREGRAHGDFLMNLPVGTGLSKGRLCSAWDATRAAASWPKEMTRRLIIDKYGHADWIHRR